MADRFSNFSDLGKALGVNAPAEENGQSRRADQGGRDWGGNRQDRRPQKISDPDYVVRAEKVIRSIGRPDNRNEGRLRFDLTSTKLRNILTLFNQIYNDVVNTSGDTLPEEIQGQIKYLRVRMVYEAGRENSVRQFVDAAGLLDEVGEVGSSKKKFFELARYMEALVAYRKFLGDDN